MLKEVTKCRVCGHSDFTKYLNLGLMPMSNNLSASAEEAVDAKRFPLEVMLCNYCSLSQLTNVIDANILFEHYVYRSGISKGYVQHCKMMAIEFQKRFNLTPDSFIIDIAGNDGTLLYEFRNIIGDIKHLNIDPAANLLPINEAKGIRQFKSFWGYSAAMHLENTHWPKADLITATNVFAHVDDISEFLLACRRVLAPKGVLVMEFPYLVDMIDNVEFDTIYFEHVSYFSLFPLSIACARSKMKIFDVEHLDIHGGSIRVYIQNIENYDHRKQLDSSDTRMYRLFDNEIHKGYQDPKMYLKWADKVQKNISLFRNEILELVDSGKKVAGFAASAKGNVLLNSAGLNFNQVSFIIDQTPEKIGKYSPGTGIPIFGLASLKVLPVDYLIILSWNFANEIIGKCRAAGYEGKFIIPIPQFNIVG